MTDRVAGSVRRARRRPARRSVRGGLRSVLTPAIHLVDKVLAAVALVITSPLIAAIALAIRLESGGPILIGHRRVGVNGRLFRMLRFRTTKAPAGELQRGGHTPANVRALPALTTTGRFIARHSLAALPQLVNVLRGDMSLIGPRPPRPEELCRQLRTRPGLINLPGRRTGPDVEARRRHER